MKRQKLCFLLILFASGCLDPYSPTLIEAPHPTLVVDGIFVAGDSSFFRLSRPAKVGAADLSSPELKAEIAIEEENGANFILQEVGNGTYFLPPIDVSFAKLYRLIIRTSDKEEYKSDFVSVMQSPDIDSLTWEEDEHGIQFYISTHNPARKASFYRWTYRETWQYSSYAYSKLIYKDREIQFRPNAAELFYCWKTKTEADIMVHNTLALTKDVVSDHPLYSIAAASRKLYYGYSVLLSQYCLTEEAYEYLKQTKSNSDDLGTLYDPMPAQSEGNIHSVHHEGELVLGFFTASSVSKRRIFISRQQLIGPAEPYESTNYEKCSGEFLPLESFQSLLSGKILIDAVYDPVTQELTGYTAASEGCMDCRKNGGSNQKPVFWK